MLRVRKMIAAASVLGALACGGGGSVDAPADATLDADAVVDAPAPGASWARALPGATECLSAQAFDDNRFVVVSGTFRGTTDFGDGARTSLGGDLFALALDLAGGSPATRVFASAGGACGALTLDGDGLLVLVGGFHGDLSFGAAALAARGPQDAYLASVSLDLPAPGVRFARRFGAIAAGGAGVATLADATVGRDGVTTAVGAGAGEIDLGLGPIAGGPVEAPLVVRVDKQGTTVFGRLFAGGPGRALGVAVVGSGASTVVGVASGAIDAGAGARPFGADGGAFVVQLDAAGRSIWDRARGDGDATSARAAAIASDLSGATVIVGRERVAAGPRGFAWKLDGHGETLWDLPIGGPGTELFAVATDVAGQIFVGGVATTSLEIGGRAFPALGAEDGLLVSLDQAGALRWAQRIGGAGARARIVHLSVTRAGALLVTGTFQGRIDLLGRALESAMPAGFIAKIVP